jgi:hypothetical protein
MKNIIFLRVKKNRDVCDVTLKEPGILNGGIPLVFFFFIFSSFFLFYFPPILFFYILFFSIYMPLLKKEEEKNQMKGERTTLLCITSHTQKNETLSCRVKRSRGEHTQREREKKKC